MNVPLSVLATTLGPVEPAYRFCVGSQPQPPIPSLRPSSFGGPRAADAGGWRGWQEHGWFGVGGGEWVGLWVNWAQKEG